MDNFFSQNYEASALGIIKLNQTLLCNSDSALSILKTESELALSFLKLFYRFTAHLGLGFFTFFLQYYSVICRPSDHTVGRPRAEIRTRAGRPRGRVNRIGIVGID